MYFLIAMYHKHLYPPSLNFLTDPISQALIIKPIYHIIDS